MPWLQECTVLLLLLQHFVFSLAGGHEDLNLSLFAGQGDAPQSGSVIHPVKTNAAGEFISHSLSHHFKNGRVRRDLSAVGQVYYKLNYTGRALLLNLTENHQLLSSDYILERRNGDVNRTESRRTPAETSCHLLGTMEVSGVKGTAAISTCNGLRGFFSLPEGHFFIEPLPKSPSDPAGSPEPHIIFPRVVTVTHRGKRSAEGEQTPSPCGVTDGDFVRLEREREEWEWEHGPTQSRSRRSVSRERWVETMVVADSKLIEYHGSDNVESYIFTIMNMVAGIFHDASIGNAIHVLLVRLILLQGEEKGLKIVHHADTTLSSFCAWQKNLNPQSDTHPAHHDLAMLVTRKDICAGMNQPCETLGLSHLSGMCQPHRSCNINEDSGLPVAFTIAHEMGHSFGIHHDGQGNDCEVGGRHPFIMSRQLMYDSSPLTWSSCSKDYITRFLDRGWGFCLDDRPSKRDLTTPLARLGVRYTTHHQCQLQYGPNATFCNEVDNICQILWCSVNGSCRSKLDSPPPLSPPLGGGGVNPCELHCRPDTEYFSEKMLDTVTDGTPCFMNNNSRNICVNGVCKEVGCDYGIDSNAVEDRCGVCLGDGTSCKTVYKSFEEGEGFGYVDVGVIPEGARDILVKETEEAGNFLALRRQGSEDYFLNGNYIIQWNGEYQAGGTTFYYERSGNMENLTAPGPTKEPVVLQLLFQENNPGLKYEYTIKKSKETGNEVIKPIYRWRHGAWTDCSTTCGLGEQHQPARCFEMDVGVVDESLCDPESRPEDRHRNCKNMDCPARWWVGGWQQCTTACGSEGLRKRTVLCVRTVSGEERVLHPVECKQLLKPKPVIPCNRDVPCGQDWVVGLWEDCPVTCGGGVRSRTVTCALAPQKTCDLATKPRTRSLCGLQSCPSSSLQRRPGPPPKYRRIYPPKRNPTKPFFPTGATTSTSATATTTTAYSTYKIPTLDHDNDPSQATPEAEERVDSEEGSTPNVVMNVPGYDYVTEERTREEEGIIDLDVGTTWFKNPLKSTTLVPHVIITPTLQTSGPGKHTTTEATTSSSFTPHATAEISHHTTLRVTPYSPRMPSIPLTTPMLKSRSVPSKTGLHTTKVPSTPLGTASWPHTTIKVIKTKKPALTPKKSVSTKKNSSRTNGNRSKSQNQPSPHPTRDPGEPVSMDVFWLVGNWSECSTSCGIGAIWRAVTCSSQKDEDCASTKKPEPARTCRLQPCATWQSGSWSKCLENCAVVGKRYRDVQCVDSQNQRPLRPFHCQAVSSKPVSTLTCPHKVCVDWNVSPWGPCSGSCGEGMRERLVYCPVPHGCGATPRPNSTESCSLKPCTNWRTEEWEQCSASCGGGQQQRDVICVNNEDSGVMPDSLCEKMSKPEALRKCNMQECQTASGPMCRKNTMSSRFCAKLKLLGRCSLRSVQRQCCSTCRS
ncbi:A disintegrin and metalloproteinase with thrombospondin motifs 12 [Phyllopteryx taeniolatus]|uniref:A disintegrin and metalloproteinase with thrombospondin motifs 12 n=1 Tax=Phyllopteryx taeniolatus TaxID=161469 RepID=UPI002AD3154D|nr:A disintegrin and metalloproteinase with thrombospondin motifs 12 [Phyllopteryx taeniolatus]